MRSLDDITVVLLVGMREVTLGFLLHHGSPLNEESTPMCDSYTKSLQLPLVPDMGFTLTAEKAYEFTLRLTDAKCLSAVASGLI
jgi:hypothetical protein